MKKLLAVVAAMVVGGAVAAYAADNVTGTKHDLSTGGPNATYRATNSDESCVFCHTPHGAATKAQIADNPLWQKDTTTTTFTRYTSTTMNMTGTGLPGGRSGLCFSCHDNTLAAGVGTVLNVPNRITSGTVLSNATVKVTGATVMTGDLANDHPVGINYDPALDTAFNTVASVTTAGVRLYGATSAVECGSCHNPHDATNAPFLRVSNAASALCKTCHIK